jgi:hypothetical protein
LIDGLAERFSSFITYLSDLVSPPAAMPPEQLEDAIQRVQEAEEAARAEAYRTQHVPGFDDPEPKGPSEPAADFARDHDDDLEPD